MRSISRWRQFSRRRDQLWLVYVQAHLHERQRRALREPAADQAVRQHRGQHLGAQQLFDIIGTTVGGNSYGWVVQNEFDGLAIDNSRLDAPGQSKFSGFYAPIDMGGLVNTVKGGSVVPVKFNLYDGSGVQVTDPSLVTVVATPSPCRRLRRPTPSRSYRRGHDPPVHRNAVHLELEDAQATGTCWDVTATATDGVSITAFFLLK